MFVSFVALSINARAVSVCVLTTVVLETAFNLMLFLLKMFTLFIHFNSSVCGIHIPDRNNNEFNYLYSSI